MNNVVMISDGQQRDSAVHIHVSILPQTLYIAIFKMDNK